MSATPLANTQESGTAKPTLPHSSKRELLAETKFQNALWWERQRSERSGNSLLLALVHLEEAKWSDRDRQLRKEVCEAMCSVIRATDTIGWYRDNKSLGMIFTELREPAKTSSQHRIEEKLRQALCATLPSERTEDVRVTYHRFPESRISSPSDRIFYSEAAPSTHQYARIMKRCMDVSGSLLALVGLSPLLLLIALAIKLTSEGPVWFRQTRMGEGGRTFTFLKFRSMFHNSDPGLHRDYVTRMLAGQDVARFHRGQTGIYKIVNDPRVTPIGRILRRSSLDELPQFFNVLKGDMSLVGPRPPLPYEFDCYGTWHRRRVLEVKPGITGLWQVYGRSRTNFDEMVRLDLRYARQWSLWLDLKLLLKTPFAVILAVGAY